MRRSSLSAQAMAALVGFEEYALTGVVVASCAATDESNWTRGVTASAVKRAIKINRRIEEKDFDFIWLGKSMNFWSLIVLTD
jgi:hypothetical protein